MSSFCFGLHRPAFLCGHGRTMLGCFSQYSFAAPPHHLVFSVAVWTRKAHSILVGFSITSELHALVKLVDPRSPCYGAPRPQLSLSPSQHLCMHVHIMRDMTGHVVSGSLACPDAALSFAMLAVATKSRSSHRYRTIQSRSMRSGWRKNSGTACRIVVVNA